MSVIVAKGEQITKCSKNTSTSNQMFTFGIGDRFKKQQKSLTQTFYDVPTAFNANHKKGFSMGYGVRKSFPKAGKKENENKTYYYKESSLLNKSCSVASFGQPPKKKAIDHIKVDLKILNFNGNVNNSYLGGEESKDFSKSKFSTSKDWNTQKIPTLKGKQKSYFDVKSNNVPGPGQYPVHQTYSSFRIKNNGRISKTAYFAKTTEKRFKDKSNNGVPGPIYQPIYGNIDANYDKLKKSYGYRSANPSPERSNSQRLNFAKESDKCKFFK
jgi:hypothetical protein